MDTALVGRVAATIVDRALCVYCIATEASATTAESMTVLAAARRALTLRVHALAPCEGCGNRRDTTYSFATD